MDTLLTGNGLLRIDQASASGDDEYASEVAR